LKWLNGSKLDAEICSEAATERNGPAVGDKKWVSYIALKYPFR